MSMNCKKKKKKTLLTVSLTSLERNMKPNFRTHIHEKKEKTNARSIVLKILKEYMSVTE